jgi:hypothetical protein
MKKAIRAAGSAGLSRRQWLAGVAAAGALSADAAPVAASGPLTADGWRRIRRVVTSEDSNGRAVVLADGEPGNSFVFNGTRITRLWETGTTPVTLPLVADAGAEAGNAYRDGFIGTSFYVAELPGGARAPAIPMHQNSTLDYMAILSGRLVLRIDDSDTRRDLELGAGDVIVQGGNLHTFINRRAEPALLLFVVVTGRRGSPANLAPA